MFRLPNASYPSGADGRSPARRLIANPITENLFISATETVEVVSSVRVASVASLVGSNTAGQATSGNRPQFTSSLSIADHRAALIFDRSRPDMLQLATRPSDGGNFSMAFCYVPALIVAAQQGLFGTVPSSSARIGFFQNTSDTTIFAAVGTGVTSSSAPSLSDPCLAILTKNASTFRLRVNGVTGSPVAHNNNTSNATPYMIGTTTAAGALPGTFWFLLAATFTGDILDGSANGAEALEAIETYCSTAYGVVL